MFVLRSLVKEIVVQPYQTVAMPIGKYDVVKPS